MKVRWRVCRVLWGEVSPKREVVKDPRRVGIPEGVSRRPRWLRRVWRLSKKEVRGLGGRDWSWLSSRRAQSITIRILGGCQVCFKVDQARTYPSTSPSTLAKNRVNSTARVFRLSLRSSSSLTMMGADVIFVDRTLSPRSHTATPVACRSPIC